MAQKQKLVCFLEDTCKHDNLSPTLDMTSENQEKKKKNHLECNLIRLEEIYHIHVPSVSHRHA